MKIDRPRSFRIPLTDEELNMVHELAAAEGLTATALVRLRIREEHARRFGANRKKTKR